MSSAHRTGRLHLLSFDDGGIRLISSLICLKEILFRLQQAENLPELPRPCDVFDLAGGTGTGGIVAIMLFRLKMSIDDAINAYLKLAQQVFSERKKLWFREESFKASLLEDGIANIIQEQLGIGREQAREIRLQDDTSKCFVCAMFAKNLGSPVLFRSWIPSANPPYNCTIIQAVRATTADPAFFKAAEFGEPIKQRYIHGGLRFRNPVKFVIEEAQLIHPNQPISCVVSLGTGSARVIGLDQPDAFQNLMPLKLVDILVRLAEDCEGTTEEMARELSKKQIFYCRLNVDHGLEAVSLAEWEKIADVEVHTTQYLKKHEIGQKIAGLVEILRNPAGQEPDPPEVSSLPTILSEDERQAFKKLEKSIAISAYHNSQQRATTTSECLPGTRSDEIATIMAWVKSKDNDKRLLAILGPAGSGKTSLLGTIATLCKEENFLGASFFFRATESDRNTADPFINTIAHQIAVNIPELRPYIARAIASDSTILSLSLETRMENLLLQPLSQLRSDHPSFTISPCVIIIDALDECADPDVQLQIISALSTALSHQFFPFRCLLSSRFDLHISNALSHDPVRSLLSNQVILGKAKRSELADIHLYLEAHIKDIRRIHPFRRTIPKDWPLVSDLNTIVTKSGGQFIYAATVIRYVESKKHKPSDRLRTVMNMAALDLDTNLFAGLDGLYHTLLASVENITVALEILSLYLAVSTSTTQVWIPESLKYTFGNSTLQDHFNSLDADIVLAPLAPVLKCENGIIILYHLSFAEFLLDSNRSREFCVDMSKSQMWIVARLVPLFFKKNYVYPGDTIELIKNAKSGGALHKAIDLGHRLVGHQNRLPTAGIFNIWPFVTELFFRLLGCGIEPKNMLEVFHRRGQNHIVLSILIKLGPTCGLSNSFLVFELCRTFAQLVQAELLREFSCFTNMDDLLLCMEYLGGFIDNSEVKILLPEDYLSATLRCLWYLQTSSSKMRSSFNSELRAGLAYYSNATRYLESDSNNVSHGALKVLPTFLSHTPPSKGLLTTLKQPFDAEVRSRTPSLSHKVQVIIHEYLMQYDTEYREEGNFIAVQAIDFAEDEPEPEFYGFLWPKSGSLPFHLFERGW